MYRVYIVETNLKTLKTRKRYRGAYTTREEAEKALEIWIRKTGKFHDIEEKD